MHSRVPTYLHPLAGRPLAWHTLHMLSRRDPPPARLLIIAPDPLSAELFADITPAPELLTSGEDLEDLGTILQLDSSPSDERLLVAVDAAAPTASEGVQRLLEDEPAGAVLEGEEIALAVRLESTSLNGVSSASDLFCGALSGALRVGCEDAESDLIRDRRALARASELIRTQVVEDLMNAGVSFLLPETVLIDVGVRIGRDSIIYPGVVLEGQTTVGEETVIGPGCRIIDSWIGSGVEMKGWNYISHTSVRNRAILEPYVRRGYD